MYAKLILRSARRSARDYLIYLVTMTLCVALFYAFLSVSSRFYKPDIGVEYDFTLLSGGMKMAICAVTLLLLFLIRFVNHYMLRSRQKEFALEAILGMDQRTIAGLFFAETLLMGGVSVVLGIGLGAVCSQFHHRPAADQLRPALSAGVDPVPGYRPLDGGLFPAELSGGGTVPDPGHPPDPHPLDADRRP